MIISLKGVLVHKSSNWAVVETLVGIGYQVFLASNTLAELEGGSQVTLWTHEYLRENARELYGFRYEREHRLFLRLIDISGVGPKMAMNILSLGKCEEIEQKIDESDALWLSRVPGVGKKTAQKIILELRGKLTEMGAGDLSSNEVMSALINLGYSREQAREAALHSGDGSVEKKLKNALKALAK
jgi:Holliday junction DNA helicase RuvA